MAFLLILLLIFKFSHCSENVNKLFEEVNEDTRKLNAKGAEIAWKCSIEPDSPELPDKAADYQLKRIIWQQNACKKMGTLHNSRMMNRTQERQAYLLCRGPKYTYSEAREMSKLYEELQSIYTDVEVCIPKIEESDRSNFTVTEATILKYLHTFKEFVIEEDYVNFAAKVAARNGLKNEDFICLKGEDDFQRIMKFSKHEEVLKWVWLTWRENMERMKEPYQKLVNLENKASRRNGYPNIGASWRDELEIPNLRKFSHHLYQDIKPLYALLHGVVRFYLRRHYGDIVPERGPIPAHLLGSLWSQNWEPLVDLILAKDINLDSRIKSLNWTVNQMLKRAEDFYFSLGLPPMTDDFWRESVFKRENNSTRCHGTAADMFKDGDVRLLYCSGVSFEDFYVIHHEMGHLQYYMAYRNQPGLFRQANTALHESIGDTVMHGVSTPQHLHRLRIIDDSELFNTSNPVDNKQESEIRTKNITFNTINEIIDDIVETKSGFRDNRDMSKKIVFDKTEYFTTDDILILKKALNKLPQIPFSLLLDEYRWKYFEGTLDKKALNEEFWAMALNFQGIAPPDERGEEYFDVGAVFYISDNTPHIRYFLSSFLQYQLFEHLCKAAVFGHRHVKDSLPHTIFLSRCDIYGSKAAGKILKDLMSRGTSQHWQQILQETIGEFDISTSALKRFYRPLYRKLTQLVKKHRIPIGW